MLLKRHHTLNNDNEGVEKSAPAPEKEVTKKVVAEPKTKAKKKE